LFNIFYSDICTSGLTEKSFMCVINKRLSISLPQAADLLQIKFLFRNFQHIIEPTIEPSLLLAPVIIIPVYIRAA